MLDTYRMFTQLRETLDERAASTITELLSSIYEDLKRTATQSDFSELKAVVQDLARAQDRTEARVEELAEAQKRTEEHLQRLDETVRRHEIRLDRLDGRSFELELSSKTDAYFGVLMRRPRVVRVSDLVEVLESRLTEEEIDDLMLLDLLVSGRLKGDAQAREAYAAVEVSLTVDDHDLDRAQRRAALLRKAGLPAVALAAGLQAHPALVQRADQGGVGVLVEHALHNRDACLKSLE
jgi:predicted nuclease with TOPRIM domain